MSLAAILGPIIARTAADVIAKKVGGQKAVPPAVADDIAKAVLAEVRADPVMKNEMNEEKPYQSRVALGAVVAALGVVAPVVGKLFGWTITGDQIVEFGSAVITLGGALYALYGRFASGLKPLFSR